MQTAVQSLITGWRGHGHALGFGAGLALGLATVGRIGSESRLDYTAIGNVVNLASRLCSVAADGQILIDPAAAAAVRRHFPLVPLGTRPLKGYDEQVAVFAVAPEDGCEPRAAGDRAGPPPALGEAAAPGLRGG